MVDPSLATPRLVPASRGVQRTGSTRRENGLGWWRVGCSYKMVAYLPRSVNVYSAVFLLKSQAGGKWF